MQLISKSAISDFLGISSAVMCIAHCVAAPFFLSIGAVLLTSSLAKLFFIVFAFLAIWHSTKSMNNRKIAYFMWFSYTIMVIASLFHEQFHWMSYGEYAATSMLISAHWLNLRNNLK
ncbi:MAG: MerC domain-containing protein [Chitinophagales bacterium]|jgi:hypothetical protein|nr:MerC domain-containing protein [Chitinophagales bacterium]